MHDYIGIFVHGLIPDCHCIFNTQTAHRAPLCAAVSAVLK